MVEIKSLFSLFATKEENSISYFQPHIIPTEFHNQPKSTHMEPSFLETDSKHFSSSHGHISPTWSPIQLSFNAHVDNDPLTTTPMLDSHSPRTNVVFLPENSLVSVYLPFVILSSSQSLTFTTRSKNNFFKPIFFFFLNLNTHLTTIEPRTFT